MARARNGDSENIGGAGPGDESVGGGGFAEGFKVMVGGDESDVGFGEAEVAGELFAEFGVGAATEFAFAREALHGEHEILAARAINPAESENQMVRAGSLYRLVTLQL